MRNLLCMLGLHFYKFDPAVQTEFISRYDSWDHSYLYSYRRNFVIGTCQNCGCVKKRAI